MITAGTRILNKEKTPKLFGDNLGNNIAKTKPIAKIVFMINNILLKRDSFFNVLND